MISNQINRLHFGGASRARQFRGVVERGSRESGNYNVSCTDNTITYWTHDEPLTSQEQEIMEEMFCQMVEHTSLEEIVFAE